jgi:hypothetical protein
MCLIAVCTYLYFSYADLVQELTACNASRLNFSTLQGHRKTRPGLPDGLFSDKKSQFGYILEGIAMEDFGTFYVILVYFMAICYIYVHLLYFLVIWHISPHFGILYQEKSGNPGRGRLTKQHRQKDEEGMSEDESLKFKWRVKN